MAFDLRAILRLDDKFSDPMRKITRQTARTEKAMDTLARSTTKAETSANRAGRSFDKMGGGIGSVTKGLGMLTGALAGVAAGYAAVEGAKKVFEATVLEAAKFEQSNVIIGAMFDDKKLAKQYTDMVDRLSVQSPILDSQTVYGNSKSFITLSKNTKELEKMWKITERLAAIDPGQGIEGAVFSLRELFSGDALSIIDRFEMPRKIMNEIKSLPLEQQLVKLDEYFNKIGMTTKLVDDMGGTTIGLWARVREQFALLLRDMGAPSLEVISGFLSNLIAKLEGGDFSKAANVGAKIIKNILTGLTNGATSLINWFTALSNSEEWKKKTTLSAKVEWIITDLFAKFQSWLDGGGREKIQKAGEVAVQILGTALSSSQGPIIEAGVKIGTAIGKGVIDGAIKYVKDNGWKIANLNPTNAVGSYSGKLGKKAVGWVKDKTSRWFGGESSHNGGLDRVPYNGYSARLHKDEAVLTRGEAAEYRAQKQGKGVGNTYQFNVTIGGGSTEQQAEQLFDIFVKKVEQAGGAGA
ncbi:hypothetical protein [Mesobacillus zeae]|uniref:Phage tail tape measure protein n=1 Tax=Mesobacillus zeae TaxID=1917180 RepID=A0A398BEZ8_9BACI|nr:hypothetical protein [Mesobacillus zeae]RID88939.1 hypothetical protein D1970_00095 [Mesobacillus zeae]